MYESIEHIETGPASQDRTGSSWFGDNDEAHAQRAIEDGFAKAVELGDANALCPWAPELYDREAIKARGLSWTDKDLPKRAPALTECMSESLDYSDGPSMTEAMQLILNAARCSDDELSAQARRLLERMCETFAYHNV